jgi:hypothetical protein
MVVSASAGVTGKHESSYGLWILSPGALATGSAGRERLGLARPAAAALDADFRQEAEADAPTPGLHSSSAPLRADLQGTCRWRARRRFRKGRGRLGHHHPGARVLLRPLAVRLVRHLSLARSTSFSERSRTPGSPPPGGSSPPPTPCSPSRKAPVAGALDVVFGKVADAWVTTTRGLESSSDLLQLVSKGTPPSPAETPMPKKSRPARSSPTPGGRLPLSALQARLRRHPLGRRPSSHASLRPGPFGAKVRARALNKR